jgi:hypothetical protein
LSYSIRKSAFTWDPQRESRGAVSARIRRHLQAELDRIGEASRRDRKTARRQASPTYQRDTDILRDHEVHGVDVPTLARQHEISATRVRELIRLQRYHQLTDSVSTPTTQASARALAHRSFPNLPVAIPQSDAVPTDP